MDDRVRRTSDVDLFAQMVTPFLSRDPVHNTILLTALDQQRVSPQEDAWFAWMCNADEVVGAALRTPPYNVALAAMAPGPAALLGTDDDSPGAIGARDVVEAFAGDRPHAVCRLETQYVLTELIPPPAVPGSPRRYQPEDDDIYVRWLTDLVVETGAMHQAEPLRALDGRLRSGGSLWFWERDGETVAMAGRSAAVCGVPRVGPVWTPPEHRRNGYAAALTAHVSDLALIDGARACTLYADAANTTSNDLYRRLGYQPVGDIVDARFHDDVS